MRNGERGATAIEYAVMVALIAAVIMVAVGFLGRTSSDTFECAGRAMSNQICTTDGRLCRANDHANSSACVKR